MTIAPDHSSSQQEQQIQTQANKQTNKKDKNKKTMVCLTWDSGVGSDDSGGTGQHSCNVDGVVCSWQQFQANMRP